MWEIGRSFAVLMAQEQWGREIDMAQSPTDLISVLDRFMDEAVIVPQLSEAYLSNSAVGLDQMDNSGWGRQGSERESEGGDGMGSDGMGWKSCASSRASLLSSAFASRSRSSPTPLTPHIASLPINPSRRVGLVASTGHPQLPVGLPPFPHQG